MRSATCGPCYRVFVWSLLVATAAGHKFEATKSNTKNLAVIITGVEDSFSWVNALDMFTSPITQQGYKVHFYIRLVGRGKQNGVQWIGSKDEQSSPVDLNDWQQSNNIKRGTYMNLHNQHHASLTRSGTVSKVNISSWKETIRGAPGAEVRFLEISDHREHVDIPDNAQPKIRMYSPVNSDIGRNLLRKFKSTEYLMRKVMEQETVGQFRYNFVMTAREDTSWLSPLNMHSFDKASNKNSVFSKNCAQWAGLNDKTFVFGREAAGKCLIGLYTQFWNNGVNDYNAERYWMRLFQSKGVQSVLVAPTELASSDTKWQSGKPCQHVQAFCAAAYAKSPVMCE